MGNHRCRLVTIFLICLYTNFHVSLKKIFQCKKKNNKIFVIAGKIVRWDRQNLFVIAGFVSTYFTVILSGFQMLFDITGSSL